MTREIMVADLGGTHARFAIASTKDNHVVGLDHQITLHCADHASLQIAWRTYAREIGRDLPREASIAIAGQVRGDMLRFTNNSWTLRLSLIPEKLDLDRFTLVNDFGAVGQAIANMGEDKFSHICGPDRPLTDDGIITVAGPGTGLGVAHILRRTGDYHVTETEGGHLDFAPLDDVEDRLLSHLRKDYHRVSAERVVSGPGLRAIYALLAELEGRQARELDDKALWKLALSGEDSLAAAAFDRFCMCLGSVAGDLALAQGAKSVVIAGGLGNRIADALPASGFHERFISKGRFRSMMEQIPVKQLLYEEPGLYGAAAAFIRQHGS